MSYLLKQEDMMDLKMEDNSDHYLFNSLLAIGHLDHHPYLDDDQGQFSFLNKEQDQALSYSHKDHIEPIVNDLYSLYNLRTTPLNELLKYAQQYYDLSKSAKLKLIKLIKRHKLTLKRQNAKERNPIKDKSEELIEEEEIKAEENALSSIVFDDESQDTKKKKRNRMSAQKSRDRKKEYIKEMEKINNDLRMKMEQVSEKNMQKLKPASRDFLKVILCLGITCFINTNQAVNSANCNNDPLIEEQRHSSETICHSDPMYLIPKVDLEGCKKMLPLKEQLLLEQALSTMSPHHCSGQIGNPLQVMNPQSSRLNIQNKVKDSLGKKSSGSFRAP